MAVDLKSILSRAVTTGASDLHLKTGVLPVIRRHGELHPLDPSLKRLGPEDLREIAYNILNPKQREQLENNNEVDCSYGIPGVGRFRVNVFRQRGTIQLVFRTISDSVPKLKDLVLPPVLEKISCLERGLVLVTGVTGSGKSTTMAAMVDFINQNHKRHIITIEDPIEYLMRDRRSIVTQRELGTDTESYSRALRAALRQDPDVIMIGEMRDKETVETAMLAAETGHLVISTLHTADAMETINRIISIYEPHEQAQVRLQLATVLKSVVSQRLAKRKDGKGLIPAVEILLNTARIKEMIAKPEKTKEIIFAIEEGFQTYGMQSFDQSLMFLLSKDFISLEEAVQLSSNPEDFELRYRGIGSQDGNKWAGFDVAKGNTFWKDMPVLEIENINPEEEIVAIHPSQASPVGRLPSAHGSPASRGPQPHPKANANVNGAPGTAPKPAPSADSVPPAQGPAIAPTKKSG